MYVTPEQEKWLLAHGMVPLCVEKGITLLEAAQWFWDNYKIGAEYSLDFTGPTSITHIVYSNEAKRDITDYLENTAFTISDAMQKSIDIAIKWVNNGDVKLINTEL